MQESSISRAAEKRFSAPNRELTVYSEQCIVNSKKCCACGAVIKSFLKSPSAVYGEQCTVNSKKCCACSAVIKSFLKSPSAVYGEQCTVNSKKCCACSAVIKKSFLKSPEKLFFKKVSLVAEGTVSRR